MKKIKQSKKLRKKQKKTNWAQKLRSQGYIFTEVPPLSPVKEPSLSLYAKLISIIL